MSKTIINKDNICFLDDIDQDNVVKINQDPSEFVTLDFSGEFIYLDGNKTEISTEYVDKTYMGLSQVMSREQAVFTLAKILKNKFKLSKKKKER